MEGVMLDVDNSDVDSNMIECLAEQEICISKGREMLDLDDGRDLTVDEVDGHVESEPHVGMEFTSEKSAMVYYDSYAKRVDFVIRVGNCHRSSHDGTVMSRRYLCNREGFRAKDKNTKRLEIRKRRESTRDGCKAMIMVRKDNSGKWTVTKVETRHNHPLGIPPGKSRRCKVQSRPQDEKDKKIKELSTALHRAKQQLAECRVQLEMALNDIEQHTNHMSRNVQAVVNNLKEIEVDDIV